MFNSGFRGKRASDNQGIVNPQSKFVQNIYPQPSIASWSISGSDDNALDPAGGQTVLVNGTGFASGIAATLNGSTISPVTLVSPTQISFTSPALAGGSYTLIVYNSSGGAAILVPGLTYSSVPTYTTAAGSIGTVYETTAISTSVVATSDSAITYSLATGSLPSGATLYANGVITGTAPADSGSTTYTFGITATDAELQDVTRTFTLTINTDVVTWSTPADGTSYTVTGNSPISNVSLSATSAAGYGVTYTANTLPTGVSLSGSTISGTPTVEQTVSTLLTATANTTSRTSTRTISWTVTLSDPYFKYVSLLLDGAPAITSFTDDASTNNTQLTIIGDAKPSLLNPYTPGYYSNYFDGTGDYLTVASNAAFQLGTGDYTFETWIYPTALGSNNSNNILNIGTYITGLMIRGAATTGIQIYTNNTQRLLTSTGLTQNAWQHIALVRNGSACTFYVNGVSIGTFTDSSSISPATATVTIGMAAHNSSEFFTGYMSNYRLVKGTAIYTTTFTPPTSPLTAVSGTSLLTCQSNRLIDNSANAFTITKNGDTMISPLQPFTPNSNYSTYGSAYFSATSAYTSYAPGGTDAFGTGDFTVECWLNPTSITGVNIIMASASTNTWNLLTYANQLYWQENGGNLGGAGYGSIPLNAWSHLAVSRSSSVLKIFINGVQVYSAANSFNYSASPATRYLGPTEGGGAPFYVSDIRIIKGTAVYTAAFTPPTSPTTAVANTQLLTYQYGGSANNSTIVDNGSFRNVIVRNGNTSQGTFSPYSQGGWSNYFDGTGDYLTTPTTSLLGATFTIEFWVYFNTFTSSDTNYQNLLGVNNTISTTGNFILLANYNGSSYTAGALTFFHQNSNKFVVAGGTFTLRKWFHVAVVRNSGTSLIMYVNGVSVGSATISSGDQYGASGVGYIIGTQNDAISRNLNGYISNLRIVNGTALYTATFTPPTSPLTAISGTSLLTCQSNRLIDNSVNNFTITKNGDTSVQAYSPFGSVREAAPISYSNYFDGTGDYLTIPTNSAFVFGTGDFTIECWFYMSSGAVGMLFDTRSGSTGVTPILYIAVSKLRYYINGSDAILSTTTLSLGTWYHVALVRISGSSKMYLNGVQTGSTYTDTNDFTLTNTINIGRGNDASNSLNGYISNLRVVKGTGVYTTAFTPPTSPLTAISGTSLLTCQSTTMIDNSTNTFTLTANGDTKPRPVNPFGYTAQTATAYSPSVNGGSIYFDGNGDYINLATSANFGFGTGDFTMEFWAYPTVNARQDWLDIAQVGSTRALIYYDGSTIYYYTTAGPSITGPAMVLNSWQHIAVSRVSGSSKMFVNGVQVGSTYSDSNNFGSTSIISIGKDSGGSTYATGYMSDIRVTKGFGIYKSNFIPPTQALSNYSTSYPSSLILNFNTGGAIDYQGSNDLETVGNVVTTNSKSPYYPGSGNTKYYSMYSDGSGDSLKIIDNPNINLGAGDFTLECWVYFNVVNAEMCIINKGWQSSSPYASYLIYMTSGASLRFLASSSGSSWDIANEKVIGTVTASSWTHVAVTRSGTSFRAFVNGVINNSFTFTSSASLASIAAQTLFIGGRTLGDDSLNGYLADVRITKGYARYTATFTPPTTPFITF